MRMATACERLESSSLIIWRNRKQVRGFPRTLVGFIALIHCILPLGIVTLYLVPHFRTFTSYCVMSLFKFRAISLSVTFKSNTVSSLQDPAQISSHLQKLDLHLKTGMNQLARRRDASAREVSVSNRKAPPPGLTHEHVRCNQRISSRGESTKAKVAP